MGYSVKDSYTSPKTLPCPFCGRHPIVVPWHGGGPRKRMVTCDNDACAAKPATIGSTEARAIRAWNLRA